MDSARPPTRVWVVPLVFALVGLSLPVQVYVKEHVSEPYPGLFQPRFSGVPSYGSKVSFRDIVLKVDGRAIAEEEFLPGENSGKRRKVLESMFPPSGGTARVDDEFRARLRSRLADARDVEPRMLTATWERRRFNLDTRKTTVIRTLSEYEIDLTGGDR